MPYENFSYGALHRVSIVLSVYNAVVFVGFTLLIGVTATAAECENIDLNDQTGVPGSLNADAAAGGHSFPGSGTECGDVDWILYYLDLDLSIVELPSHKDLMLRIGYGGNLDAASFRANLDGDDITGRFTPTPSSTELVILPIFPGTHMLKLEAAVAQRHQLRDIDKFTIIKKSPPVDFAIETTDAKKPTATPVE